MKLLYIGSVFPEPESSAAGRRVIELIGVLQKGSYEVHFASAAQKSDHSYDLNSLAVSEHLILLNDSSFDELLKELNPSVVIYDRFMIEEQYGWRVADSCPSALRILDTIDLHCLRLSREECFKADEEFQLDTLLENDTAKREIASILRSDLSLLVSSYEMEILESLFQIDVALLHYLPFLIGEEDFLPSPPPYSQRQDFISIGGFHHPPNRDSVFWLKEEIWSLIRAELPEAKLYIYGSYVDQAIRELNNEQDGFLVHGRADSVVEVMGQARVNLAPLRFGAGIKGKLADGMTAGIPSVTTGIGAEGMYGDLALSDWGGTVAESSNEMAEAAVELHNDPALWKEAQEKGYAIARSAFDREKHSSALLNRLSELTNDIAAHRRKNFLGAMLMHHSLQSSKYLSKWIEEKNKSNLP